MPEPTTTELRVWRKAWDLLRDLEEHGGRRGDPAGADRRILACQRFLETSGVPRLARLAALLHPGLTPRELLAVLVPVERMASRIRIGDAEMGVTGADRTRRNTFPLVVVADSIRSALNLGGLFRTADAIGAEALWLCGYSATPEHRDVRRSALGAEQTLPWRHWDHLAEALAALREAGTTLCALETSTEAQPVEAHVFAFPCALVLGNERFGLNPELLATADHRLRIEMHGVKNSLNVVSALAVAGFAARWSWTRKEHHP